MPEANAKPRRRWFQFSLRTLLIAVTLVAGLLAAPRVFFEPYRRWRKTIAIIKELGGRHTTESGGPAWMRDWFGDDNFQNITLLDAAPSSATRRSTSESRSSTINLNIES